MSLPIILDRGGGGGGILPAATLDVNNVLFFFNIEAKATKI